MRELDTVASNLFDKIRTRFENISLGDEKAKRTSKPSEARFFNFDYISKDRQNFGNVTMSILNGDGLKVYFSKNITDKLDSDQQDEWFAFLRGIRKFAKQNFMSFDARDINKSGLDLRDIQQQSKADAKFTASDVSVSTSVAESKLYGTRNVSFQECGPVKIRIKHSRIVDEESHGARSRDIEAIFLDNHMGERHLLPFTNLHGARAMAQHCSQGGKIGDALGQHICDMVTEMGSLRSFVLGANRRQFEDMETSEMASAASHRYSELRNRLHHLSGRKGYGAYKENFTPETPIEEEIDVESLRDRFAKKVYNDKFTSAFPYVYRAYKNHQAAKETPMGSQFESWAHAVTEDAFESDDDRFSALQTIMSKPLIVGLDGVDAANALQPIFADDSLSETLARLAAVKGPDVDARRTVLDWLHENGMAFIAQDIEDGLTKQKPTQQQKQENNESNTNESVDNIALLKHLAGIRN